MILSFKDEDDDVEEEDDDVEVWLFSINLTFFVNFLMSIFFKG